MPDVWAPGVERYPIDIDGGSMVGGPPRAVEHITWDAPNPSGVLPGFAVLRRYFATTGKGSAPHILRDPCTGEAVQFIPANRASRALKHPAGTPETNRAGSVNIQIEWRFSTHGKCPACQVTHKTLRETKMLGLVEHLAWCESLGIPSVWAVREPDWGSQRNPTTWAKTAGHYGHSQVPYNDHTDPGPMPLTKPAQKPAQPNRGYTMLFYAIGTDAKLLPYADTYGATTTNYAEANRQLEAGGKMVVLGGPALAAVGITWCPPGQMKTQGAVTACNGTDRWQTAHLMVDAIKAAQAGAL